MRIEIKEGKTYYISNDGIHYTDKWDCIQHDNWIKEDDRRVNLQQRWNELINSLPMEPGECPVYQEASTDYIYTYITIKSKEELEKINDIYTIASLYHHKVEYTGNFPMVVVMETNTELYMVNLEKCHLRLCTLDHIKSETLWYWKELGYNITIEKKEESEESEER